MALTDCSECGHQVSETAQSCPSCGHPLTAAPSVPAGAPRSTVSTSLIFAVIGGAALVIGSLLPWVSIQTIFGRISASGTDGDGILTMIAGAVVALVAGVAISRKNASRTTGVLIAVLGVISGLIAFNVFSNLTSVGDVSDGVFTAIGGGLWLVIVGAAVAAGAGTAIAFAQGEGALQPRSALAGVGVGVAVVALMLVAVAVLSDQADRSVQDTFDRISDQLGG